MTQIGTYRSQFCQTKPKKSLRTNHSMVGVLGAAIFIWEVEEAALAVPVKTPVQPFISQREKKDIFVSSPDSRNGEG